MCAFVSHCAAALFFSTLSSSDTTYLDRSLFISCMWLCMTQAVSEAYEQLINQRTRSASGQSTSSSTSSAYRYSYTRHGYQHTQYYRDRGKTRSSSIGSKFISFVYMLKSTGSLAATALVGGVFIGGLLAFDPLISTLWVERNKGKSFEDMIAEVERAKAIKKGMQHIIANHMDHRSMVLKRLMHQCMSTLDS